MRIGTKRRGTAVSKGKDVKGPASFVDQKRL